jgi:endonuclease YncB( thermonuclease family)
MTKWEFPRCVVDHVHDGDTIVLKSIDLGLDVIRTNIRVRFYAYNAPELNTPEGKIARDYLSTLIKPDQQVVVSSAHWDKYANRIDGLIYTSLTGEEVGKMMFAAGYVKEIL